MLRYIRKLESRDLSLCTSMIPLGSCTMKLNATAEMFPVSWPTVGRIHPFAPSMEAEARGYLTLIPAVGGMAGGDHQSMAARLAPAECRRTQGSGMPELAIRAYHRGSAGKTIAASASFRFRPTWNQSGERGRRMAGMRRSCPWPATPQGISTSPNLRAKADEHAGDLACAMITYPSTHGAFEDTIVEAARKIIHSHGGQVYHGRREHDRPGRALPSGRFRAWTSAT